MNQIFLQIYNELVQQNVLGRKLQDEKQFKVVQQLIKEKIIKYFSNSTFRS
jgi:hypothetical protein